MWPVLWVLNAASPPAIQGLATELDSFTTPYTDITAGQKPIKGPSLGSLSSFVAPHKGLRQLIGQLSTSCVGHPRPDCLFHSFKFGLVFPPTIVVTKSQTSN